MGPTFGAAHLVKDQVARNFQQPRGKLGAWNISTRAFPDTDKNLLRDVFHVRTGAQHARNRTCHQGLMFFDQPLICLCIASADKLHQSNVLGIFFRPAEISSIVLRHRDLDVRTPKIFQKNAIHQNLSFHHPRSHRFCCNLGTACACLRRDKPEPADELPADSKGTEVDRRKG